MPPHESDAAAGKAARTRGGQKCNVITQSEANWDPLPGLTETGQTPTTHPATLPAPEGSSRQLRNFGIGIQQGLQLGGEFLPSSLWPFHCLSLASRCSMSGSIAPPPDPLDPRNVLILFLLGGARGHARQRHASLTGNELQTVIIIKLKIYAALESGRINRADEEGLCY